MKDLDYAAIRRAITMRQVFELIPYEPSRIVGDQWRGPCPICRESSRTNRHPFSANIARMSSNASVAIGQATCSISG